VILLLVNAYLTSILLSLLNPLTSLGVPFVGLFDPNSQRSITEGLGPIPPMVGENYLVPYC
jgi:hypothetical protein